MLMENDNHNKVWGIDKCLNLNIGLLIVTHLHCLKTHDNGVNLKYSLVLNRN